MSILKQVDLAREEIAKHHKTHIPALDVTRSGNLRAFRTQTSESLKLIFAEKEIIVFSLLQWVTIGLAYYFWVQILAVIPSQAFVGRLGWKDIPLHVWIFGWSFLCVGAAALPIGFLSGCIGAAHLLRSLGLESTVLRCCAVTAPALRDIWMFAWIDSWLTVDQIFDRLPRKGSGWLSETFSREAVYYTFKVGTVGLLAAMLNGRKLVDASKESAKMAWAMPTEVLRLRGGYSLVCWITGVTAFVLGSIWLMSSDIRHSDIHFLYKFYCFAGIPVLLAATVVVVFLRPIFIIGSSQLYARYAQTHTIKLQLPSHPGYPVASITYFSILTTSLLCVYLFREQLGITQFLDWFWR